MEIDRYHRVESGNQCGQHQERPPTIICRFNMFKDKQEILNNAKKLRDTGIYIYQDFSKDTMDLRNMFGRKYYSIEDKIKMLVSVIEVSL